MSSDADDFSMDIHRTVVEQVEHISMDIRCTVINQVEQKK